METITRISGNIVDIVKGRIYPGTLEVSDGRISRITQERERYGEYIIPGFIDSHIHVESSMLTPSEFARIAVIHGTVGAVCDPHEIANVMGVDGLRYMAEDGASVPFKFFWGAPSCVPATGFETSGARIDAAQMKALFEEERVGFLSEVMDVPGVLHGDPDLAAKINVAKSFHKPIDGHAPGLRGEALKRYIGAGISTDHECVTYAEAMEKLTLGMKVQIREGSAAKNFNDLIPIAQDRAARCMFCSDDKHPDDLLEGHINLMLERAVGYGIDPIDVLRIASLNPIRHYGLEVGLLQVDDPADFLIVDDLRSLRILKTVINGKLVAKDGMTMIPETPKERANVFRAREKKVDEFKVGKREGKIRIIEARDGQVITGHVQAVPKVMGETVVSDPSRDILKIAVVNRYEDSAPSVGFIRNFGLERGAIGSSVAHDSHNIVAVGASDTDILRAVNLIIQAQGGISAVSDTGETLLPLPVAGIMSDLNYEEVARRYRELDAFAKQLGSLLTAPFMTLSFMALPVIPELKISDRGLFDVVRFEFIDLFASQ
ncbi:MAG: adenine deaminase [Deltaproteobacteria bacterium]|nr:adenine deaminase [Deltaproteobacteria bacterium]MBW2079041.1 adenine deaminase [Deltaproteobacteria bacterium]MBW2312142.1 adenine deaminase [Deltaproteobacteria bacterium]RLB29850.1 MAG: adenine deaminase [Deltaproteobacteria bacterium]